jgi:hypothetical protein
MADFGLSTIIPLLGSVVSGVGTFMAGQAQANINEFNANVADDNAKRAIERAQIEQQDQDLQTRALVGEQLAQQSASGVDVGVGSTKYSRMAARELGRRDALNIRQAGELESADYKNQATSSRMQASATRTGAAFGLLGSFLDAGSVITKSKKVAKRNYAPTPSPRPQVLR